MPDARWLQHLLDAATVDESVGSARLRRAVGVEPFETVAGGMHMVNYLDPAQAP